jgi:RND family efflux transporter MFP subunit
MNRKLVYVVLGVVIIAAVAGGLVWRDRQRAAQAERQLRSTVVERGDMIVEVTASGSVQPARRAELSFETTGRVADVRVRIGDEVAAGDLLVTLDSDQLELQVEQAEANLTAAQAQLAKLKAGAGAEEIEASRANVRAAAAQADAAAAERDQLASGAGKAEIAAAEAEVASALTQQKKAEDLHEATMRCVTVTREAGDVVEIGDGQTITLTEGFERTICPLLGVPEEQARYRLQAANEGLEAARARLKETRAGANANQLSAAQSNVAAAVARRDAAQAQLDLLLEGATEDQIEAAETSVEQAQASLRQAELALEQTGLEAPFDGIVAAVNVSTGQQVAAGIPVLSLVKPEPFHVVVGVDELDVRQLARGQRARLSFDALRETVVTGTVGRIAEAAGLDEGVVTYDVRIDPGSSDAPIRADMTASASIVVEEISDALKIPTWAVHIDSETGQYYVRRRSAEGIERVDITLGARNEGIAQVLEGLSAGDEIVRVPEASQLDQIRAELTE